VVTRAYVCGGLNRSVQRLGEFLGRCHPVQGLSRSAVESCGDVVEIGLGEVRLRLALGEVLAKQPVGVLVAAALPRAGGVTEGSPTYCGAQRWTIEPNDRVQFGRESGSSPGLPT